MTNSLHIYIRVKYLLSVCIYREWYKEIIAHKNDNFRLNIIRSVLYLFTKKIGLRVEPDLLAVIALSTTRP